MKFQMANFKLQIFAVAAALICFPAAGNISAEEILPNGNFEKADETDPARPAGWDRVDGLGGHRTPRMAAPSAWTRT